jgi:hypothetical protein
MLNHFPHSDFKDSFQYASAYPDILFTGKSNRNCKRLYIGFYKKTGKLFNPVTFRRTGIISTCGLKNIAPSESKIKN